MKKLPRIRRTGLRYIANGTLLGVVAVCGAGQAGAETGVDDSWQVVVAPYLWALSLDGNAQVGALEADVDAPFSDTLSNLNGALMMIIDARKDRIGLVSNIMYSRIQNEQGIGSARLDATNDSGMVSIAAYYRILEHTHGQSASGKPLRVVIEPELGVRWTHMSAELKLKEAGTSRQLQGSENWVDPFVGARFKVDFSDRWDIAVEGDVGGFGVGSDYTWGAHALLGYHFKLFGHNSALRFGYRALYQDYDSGSGRERFKWDVTQHGPILGIATVY